MAKETKYRLLKQWSTPEGVHHIGTLFEVSFGLICFPTGHFLASVDYADAHPDWFEKVEVCTECKREICAGENYSALRHCACADEASPNEDFQVRCLWGDLNCTIHIDALLDRLEAEKAWREWNKAK